MLVSHSLCKDAVVPPNRTPQGRPAECLDRTANVGAAARPGNAVLRSG